MIVITCISESYTFKRFPANLTTFIDLNSISAVLSLMSNVRCSSNIYFATECIFTTSPLQDPSWPVPRLDPQWKCLLQTEILCISSFAWILMGVFPLSPEWIIMWILISSFLISPFQQTLYFNNAYAYSYAFSESWIDCIGSHRHCTGAASRQYESPCVFSGRCFL